jgi:anti-sigma factor RsiW
MECPLQSGQAAELIVGYPAQTLDSHAAGVLERHLKDCARCRQLSAAQQAVWSALDAWKPQAISPDFDRKLFERIAEEERLPWWRRVGPQAWSWLPAISVTAACAALLAAFLLRAPTSIPAPAPAEPKFQIEQVENALDDMDMLKQIGVEAAPVASGSRERI